MSGKLRGLIEKWWWLASLLLMLAIFIYGYREMYFHQDDLDWFRLVNSSWREVFTAPLSDHINYLFRLLFKWEWDTFGFNYPPYLLISLVLHVGVVGLIYTIAKVTSGRRDLAAIAALIFSVNTNWTEVILWTSGQTISISALFILIASYMVWKKQKVVQYAWLANLTSALALGLLPSILIVYGVDYQKWRMKKVALAMILIMIFVVVMYLWRATDGTKVEMSLGWVVKVMEVMGLSVINTVVGRLWLPFDRFEWIRIGVTTTIGILAVYKWRGYLREVIQDQWSRFLGLQILFYYLVVAIGRAQYGVGIMRAERYGYLGLALVLLLAVRVLRKWKIGKWIWMVPIIIVIQSMGLYRRANDYIVRPSQLKS